ncbi:MAG: peptidase family C69 [Sandaracinus sp.]|nr:peptidase family C69 [Sandaracinus sp.]
MCDTVVIARDGEPVWIAKNSDREPDEAQAVDRFDVRRASPRTDATGRRLPFDDAPLATIQSRPAWLFGCEMGVNEAGLAVANEATFSCLPVPDEGLTGMDLQRLVLERATTADDALALLVELLDRFPQGGPMARRDRSFRYFSSFVLADARRAWIVETAGPHWAAKRVRGVATLSNVHTIGSDFDRVSPGAADAARRLGRLREGALDFAHAFGDRRLRPFTGGDARRACTLAATNALGAPSVAGLASVLRDHGPHGAAGTWRMEAPCAHASFWPTRAAGQTTGSMIVRLDGPHPTAFFTGTSSPCLSVFKPAAFDGAWANEPPVGVRPGEDLWWRHERLHRAVLANDAARRPVVEPLARALEAEANDDTWAAHREAVLDWTSRARAAGHPRAGPFERYWTWREWRDA